MHPKLAVNCERCGSPAEFEVVPDSFDDNPATFTMTRTCSAGCPTTYTTLSAEKAREITRQSYDGVTGRWSRLS